MPQMPLSPPSIRSAVASNTMFQLLGRAISAASTLFVTISIARISGSEGYGDFVKITTFVAFYYLIADFGLNAVYLQQSQESSKNGNGADPAWGVLVGLRILLSFLLVAVALGVLLLFPPSTTQGYTAVARYGIILFLPTIFFQSLITTFNAVFQKHLRYNKATAALCIGSLVTVASVVSASVSIIPFSIPTVVASLLLGSAATAGAAFYYARPFVRKTHLAFDEHAYRDMFVASIPLGMTLLFNLIYFHVDSIILTLTRSTAEVGIYGLAYKVFELPLVIPTFFMNAMYPILLSVQRKEEGTQAKRPLRSIVKKSASSLAALSCLLVIVLWAAAPFLVFIKSDFEQSIWALRVLSLGLPLFFLSSLTMWTLITLKKQVQLMYVYGLSMVFNLLLNLWLVPIYGFMAAAWITVVSEALVLVCSGILVFAHMNKEAYE